MADPADCAELKRELGELLVERKSLIDEKNAWLYLEPSCVDPDVYISERMRHQDYTRKLVKIGVRIGTLLARIECEEEKTTCEPE
jgi:hypothetical protein